MVCRIERKIRRLRRPFHCYLVELSFEVTDGRENAPDTFYGVQIGVIEGGSSARCEVKKLPPTNMPVRSVSFVEYVAPGSIVLYEPYLTCTDPSGCSLL